ncbi:MAG: RagB/SusD family nutrient uptake outer membrane protein [Dysgonamonadaceae bacterium]|jgi:hypothetical protein|nr:RagB/SusD family nutrient uptake outer membrane protein [Dysgonamonadaceae bacterium]
MKFKKIIIVILAIVTFSKCADFLAEDLNNRIVLEEYFQHRFEAVSFLYSGLESMTSVFFGTNYLHTFELASDQIYFTGRDQNHRNMNILSVQNSSSQIANVWQGLYRTIARMNMLIDRLETLPTFEGAPETPRLMAQARFIRAFCYFQAVQLWGPVPITPVYHHVSGNIHPSRSSVADVYTYIIDDLLFGLEGVDGEGVTFLRDFDINNDGGKIMPDRVIFRYPSDPATAGQSFWLPISKGAAQLLLAKVYLTRNESGDHNSAEALVDGMIVNPLYRLMPNYEDLFQTDRKRAPNRAREVLFEIEASFADAIYNGTHREVAPNSNSPMKPATISVPTIENGLIVIRDNVPTVHNELVLAGTASGFGRWVPTEHFLLSFNPLRDRRYWWMYQFVNATDNLEKPSDAPNFRKGHDHLGNQNFGGANAVLLRFADVFLIKAELRARAGDGAGVAAAMRPVLERAGLGSYNSTGKDIQQMIDDVIDERAREFAHEAGNRLFDMRRVGFKRELERGFTAWHQWFDEELQMVGQERGLMVFINPKAKGNPVTIMMVNPVYRAEWDSASPAYNPPALGTPEYDAYLAYDPSTPAIIPNPRQDQTVGGDRYLRIVPFLNHTAGQLPYRKFWSERAEFHPIPIQEVLKNPNLDNSMHLSNYN